MCMNKNGIVWMEEDIHARRGPYFEKGETKLKGRKEWAKNNTDGGWRVVATRATDQAKRTMHEQEGGR